MPSNPALSWRHATAGGMEVQSNGVTIAGPAARGAEEVAEAVLTARTPHIPTLAPSTARVAPTFRSTRLSRAVLSNSLTSVSLLFFDGLPGPHLTTRDCAERFPYSSPSK
jgi:hypothetical protein